jgi:membrane protein required for beta-lactamase induction
MSAQWRNLPVSLPSGALLPHMSGRLRAQTIDALFELLGGIDRARAWVEASDDNYKEFFRLWARGATRPTAVELTADGSVEDLLAKLDAGEHAKVIDG